MKTFILFLYSIVLLVTTFLMLRELFTWPYDNRTLLFGLLFLFTWISFFFIRKKISSYDEKAFEFFIRATKAYTPENKRVQIFEINNIEAYLSHIKKDVKEIEDITILERTKLLPHLEVLKGIVFARNNAKARKKMEKFLVDYHKE